MAVKYLAEEGAEAVGAQASQRPTSQEQRQQLFP